MKLIPWRNKQKRRGSEAVPVNRLEGLREEGSRLFEHMMGVPWSLPDLPSVFGAGELEPSLDLSETDEEVIVQAEIPGVQAKDINVSLTGDILTISGEKREEKESKGRHQFWSETRYGSFSRSVRLPTRVDPDKVEAESREGVLTIRLPKVQSGRPRKISIRGS